MQADDNLLFPEWAPDLTPLGTGVSAVISGVKPQADGYGPWESFVEFTAALPAPCRGAFYARNTDGSITGFAGTIDRLYRLNNIDFTWVDVSQGGIAYPALVGDANWDFKQFNDLVIAVQQNVPPQKYTLSAGGTFVDLGGSPPSAGKIAIINGFVVLTALLSNPRRAHWCDLFAPETWTAGVGLADFQDFPDGGSCKGISGGDAYGLVFQETTIRSLTYAPGSAVTFQIARISEQDPLFAQYSIVTAGSRTFFCSAQGFRMVEAGGVPKAIGRERVDRTFFADVDENNLQLMIGVADPSATRVYWAYKSKAGSDGLFDKMLTYDWSIGDNGRFTVLPISGQYLASFAKPGITLEQLDAIAPTPLQVQGAADNGAGAIRLTLDAVANADFAIAGQNFIVVQGVEGTVEANGAWSVTIIDGTHIDLIGSAFVHAYTGGGAIGGSLDKLPFSLDSFSTAAVAALSAFNPDGKLGFFNGPNIEAILETEEKDLRGRLVFISNTKPLTDSAEALVSIGGRMNAQSAPIYGSESAILVQSGDAPVRIETRYARARLRIPAGSVWSYARSIQPEAQLAGEY